MNARPSEHPTRRAVLATPVLGLGGLACARLLGVDGDPAPVPHHRPRIRSVIQLGMIGAPSQLDLFEHKPLLDRHDGEVPPAELLRGEHFAFLGDGTDATLLASPWPKARHGRHGTWLSDLLPHHRRIVDKVTWLHALETDVVNHVPAQMLLHTGSPRPGRPTLGAWLDWGLGRLADDLPAYVVLASGKAGRCGTACWQSGFLPSRHQGVALRADGEPVLFLEDPAGLPRAARRAALAAQRDLDRGRLAVTGDPDADARIAAAELAFRMQRSVPELTDLGSEDPTTLELYGAVPGQRSFGANCLLARRLVERGCRFVQLVHGGWDHHGGASDQNLFTNLPQRAREVDRGAAALVLDLERRGLLAETLVLFGGEFGRTPMLQGPRSAGMLGRDHQRTAFSMWIAGGDFAPGLHHGTTDDFGFRGVDGVVHVHDLNATLLDQLGIDHERFTFRSQGRDYRLTDVHGRVVHELYG